MPFDEDTIHNFRNRPQFAPGMNDDDDDDDDDDFHARPSGLAMRQQSFNSTPGLSGGSPFSNNFNPSQPGGFGGGGIGGSPFNRPMGGGMSPMGGSMNQQQQNQPKTAEDVFWSGAKGVATGAKSFFGALHDAFSGNSHMDLAKSTHLMVKVSAIGLVCSGVALLLSLVLPVFKQALAVTVGCLFNMAIGLIIYPILYEKGRNEVIENPTPKPFTQQPMLNSIPETTGFDDDEDDDFDGFGESDFEPFDDDDDEDSYDDPFEDDDDFKDEDVIDDDFDIEPEELDSTEAIEQMPAFEPRTQTRSCLFEQYMRVLPRMQPDFYKFKNIDKDADIYKEFQQKLITECEKLELPESVIPEIQSITENGFMYTLKFISKNKKVLAPATLNTIADQMAIQMMFDPATGIQKPDYKGFTGRYSIVGTSVFIYIFKGSKSNSLISLADASMVAKDKILDPHVEMPVICGIGETGNVNITDYVNVESQIISGLPRSGKSWQAQAILIQMCMYKSPREIVFEAFDTKGKTSDFYMMVKKLPHFRVFKSDPLEIVNRLKYLTTVEVERRDRIISQAGVINIKDLHKRHPEVELPYLYVIIDEMKALSADLMVLSNGPDKEYKFVYKEYCAYLGKIVTKTPNLGIRGIYIPHRLVEEIIPKTARDMINSKMLVRAPRDEIEKQLSKQDNFTYQLTQPGDMAMKDSILTSDKLVFNHGVGVTGDNNSNENFYTFVGALWKRFEPDFYLHTDQLLDNSNLYGKGQSVDYRRDPLGKGSPATEIQLDVDKPMNYNTGYQQPRPQQRMNQRDLFSSQMERGFEALDDDDDDEFEF